MEKLNFKSVIGRIKIFIKHFMFYLVFILSLIAGFSIGYYYNTLKTYRSVDHNREVISKKNITVAIDEHNNLIIFNDKTGVYSTYADSVGLTIFNFYAKNIWGEHASQPK